MGIYCIYILIDIKYIILYYIISGSYLYIYIYVFIILNIYINKETLLKII